MWKSLLKSIIVYAVLAGGVYFSAQEIIQAYNTNTKVISDYSQPAMARGKSFAVKSIDTQVVSKHWKDVPKSSIREQVTLIKKMGANYVAVSTPYDRVNELQAWADEIHAQGMHVWFRSHWAAWEGDDNQPPVMTSQEYLTKTKQFIIEHPQLFREGDAFTVAVEPEQAGVGLGKKFKDWDDYRTFILQQMVIANDGFKQIGLQKKIHTNWISVNGWIVDNVFTKELVEKLGVITVDHYPVQSQTIGSLEDIDILVRVQNDDMERWYKKWKKPVLMGEWGYQIYQEVSDDRQATVIKRVLESVEKKPYVLGVNYWVHMGHHSRLIGDENGSSFKNRKSADALKAIFTK